MRNFELLPPALYYLFLVFVCKGNKFICRTQIILLKSLCFYLLLTFINKYIYILNTILQIKVLPHLIIYRAIIRGSRGGCPPWCPRWLVVLVLAGVLAGGVLVASWLEVSSWWLVSVECSSLVAGGASLVVLVVAGGVLVVSWLASWLEVSSLVPPWWSSWWLVVSSLVCARIFTAGHAGGGTQGLSSAAALSLVNRSCKGSLLDAIALIINYLDIPFGVAFTG